MTNQVTRDAVQSGQTDVLERGGPRHPPGKPQTTAQRPVPGRDSHTCTCCIASWFTFAAVVALLMVVLGALAAVSLGAVADRLLPEVRGKVLRGAPGEYTPDAALLLFAASFNEPDADDGKVGRLIMADRRDELLTQRRDYMRQIRETPTWEGLRPDRLEFGGTPDGDRTVHTTITGDSATTGLWVRASWVRAEALPPNIPAGVVNLWRTARRPWTAEARRDETGWRLWSVNIPPWCATGDGAPGGYAECAAPNVGGTGRQRFN